MSVSDLEQAVNDNHDSCEATVSIEGANRDTIKPRGQISARFLKTSYYRIAILSDCPVFILQSGSCSRTALEARHA